MLTPFLLNETSPIEFGLLVFSIPAAGLYIGFLALLLNRKSFTWRAISFIGAIVLALLGLFMCENLTWLISIFVFTPLLLGIYGYFFMPRNSTKS
ncbi:hypothetical protein EJV47_19065 [Hymenobacter gummosus]|uniref:Uncharacterized protein n=1 Tax=Hymenobacter gummosus TaxID=1776032 RepID=A0A3S0QG67_9BACT|nr:hypothetical protein [Hymenobacter gummosus]RTQ47520.1 hypothetical protein EJV47_19065 [Hymenobacter gummosus]